MEGKKKKLHDYNAKYLSLEEEKTPRGFCVVCVQLEREKKSPQKTNFPYVCGTK